MAIRYHTMFSPDGNNKFHRFKVIVTVIEIGMLSRITIDLISRFLRIYDSIKKTHKRDEMIQTVTIYHWLFLVGIVNACIQAIFIIYVISYF